jgi:DNA-binding transcriptional ArsR family regulator
MPKTISRDFPLSEITLRRYEKPYNMPRRELIRKICLSVGLLQPGDSRDIVVDVFHVLLNAAKNQTLMNSEDIKAQTIELRKKAKLPLKGVASSNIRRQLKRLRELYLVEKVKNEYRVTEFEQMNILFEEKIEKYYLASIIKRVQEYFRELKH